MQIECVYESQSLLGEGPLWRPEKKELFWLDILEKKIHLFNPAKKTNTTHQLNQPITALSLTKTHDLLVTLKKEIAFFNWDTKKITPLCSVELDKPHHRFNDAKCDPKGRFWAGTMNEKDMREATGALYRFEGKGKIERQQDGLCLSNGMGWSPDHSTFYLVESFRYAIFAYDFDVGKGTISNKRIFAQLETPSKGCPDGMTVDSHGYVWSAQPGLGRIVRYHPNGKIDQIIQLPVLRPSSCIFGGENLETLYIPTARELMTEEELAKYPLSGSLFAIKTGIKGVPEPYFIDQTKG